MSKKKIDVVNSSKAEAATTAVPEQAIELAGIPGALPEILTPLLLVDAQLYQYGELLLIKLADGRLLIIKNFFLDAPDQGLPADIASGEFVTEMFISEADEFKSYIDELAQTNTSLFNSINSQLDPAVQWQGKAETEVASSSEVLGDGLADLPTIQNDQPSQIEPPTGDSLNQPTTFTSTTSLGGLGDTDGAAASAPNASALGSLSSLSLGGLGGGSAQGLSSIGGALGSATNLALAPPSDALASNSSGVEMDLPSEETVDTTGGIELSIAELNYRFAGTLQEDIELGGTSEVTFTDAENWISLNGKASSSGATGTFSAARLQVDMFFGLIGEPTFTSFTITIESLGSLVVDLTTATGTETIAEAITTAIAMDAEFSDAGIRVFWNGSSNTEAGFNTYGALVITDPSNREITEAFITQPVGQLNLIIGNDIPVQNISGLRLGGADHNITQFRIEGENEREESFSIGGVNNPDFISLQAGVEDYDSLSFTDPDGGNADYDFATNSAYTKITGISHIEARGNGDNTVLLNQAAVRGMTDTSISAANIWSLDISGDAADSVDFTDAASWEYSGIIADSIRTVTFFFDGDVLRVVTQDLGNIQYQYIAVNGVESYTVNVSADILDHPDWYWTGGTSGDDAYELPDTQFGGVDFGAGTDTLELNSGLVSKTQNFIGEGGDLANVEIINLTNTQSGNATATIDTATVDRSFVTDATDSNNTLSFIGDSVDSVAIADVATDWTFLGSTAGSDGLAGLTFNQYAYRPGEAGEVILNIETELATAIPNYYRGWESDDIINIQAGDFAAIDGGLGRDTAVFATSTGVRELDLTESTTTINNIEIFDMRNSSEENITFDLSGVARAEDDIVFVLGDAGLDSVDVTNAGDWTLLGRANFTDAPDTYLYQGSGGEALYVQTNLLQSFERLALGTEGDDVFRVIDTDFGTLNGGGGSFDRINFLQDGNINLANLGGSSLTSVEVADLTNGVANNLSLTAASIESAASSDQFYILGEAGDSVTLSAGDNWQFQDSIAVSASLTLDSYTSTATGGTTVYVDSQVVTSVA